MSSFDKTGYNEADRVFHAKDAELIARIRAKLDENRAAAQQAGDKTIHWMHCPKCGGEMRDVKQGTVHIDQCTKCGGVYMDAGEMALLIAHQRPTTGMLDDLFNWLPKWQLHRDKFITGGK